MLTYFNMNKVYSVIKNTRFFDKNYAYGEEKGALNLGDAEVCPVCKSELTNMKWLPPYLINVSKEKIGDLIFGSFNHFVVSQTFVDLYRESNLLGIKSFIPVDVNYD